MRFIRYTAAILLVVWLQACGSGSNNSSPTATVSGVAATGVAMDGTVTLKDSTGNTRSAVISLPSGAFNMDISGLTPPYFLKATNSSGTLTLYSVATGSGTFNINPLSNLVVVAAAMSIDPLAKTPDAAFNNPANFRTLSAAQIQAATDSVMAKMSPAFKAALAANNVTQVNPLTDSYQIGDGLDKVFDGFVVTLNSATGEVQELQVASNTTAVVGLVDMLGTFPSAGVYDGTVTMPLSSGGTHLVRDLLITSSGEMRYVMDNGIQVVATLTASGSTVTGTGMAYAPTLNGQPTNFQFADGSLAINLTINGALGTGTFSGTYNYGSFSDTFSFSLNDRQTKSTASLDKITGTFASSSDSNTDFIGHIEPDGKIWGSGPGIGYSGLIQVVDPEANIYRVTLAYLQNGTYGFVSGLATFYDSAPAGDILAMPATLVPDGYTGEIANLSYSQSISGNQGKLVMMLSNLSRQISIGAVRMSSQAQTIASQPSPDTLLIQAVDVPTFTMSASGDINYSVSSALMLADYRAFSAGGTLYLNTNPGNFTLNGGAVVFTLNNFGSKVYSEGSTIDWQTFAISGDAVFNNSLLTSNQIALNSVTVTGSIITGSLAAASSNYGSIQLTGNCVITGSLVSSLNGGTLVLTGSSGTATGGLTGSSAL
jgi:hypothetical protein